MMNVDALWMENGIVLVWEWGQRLRGSSGKLYQLPDVIPNWKREIKRYALESTPVFVEDLGQLGRGSHSSPSKVRSRSGRNAPVPKPDMPMTFLIFLSFLTLCHCSRGVQIPRLCGFWTSVTESSS